MEAKGPARPIESANTQHARRRVVDALARARAAADAGRVAVAEREADGALRLVRRALGKRHILCAPVLVLLGQIAKQRGATRKAHTRLDQALDLLDGTSGPHAGTLEVEARRTIAMLHLTAARYDEAERHLARALDRARRMGPAGLLVGRVHGELGVLCKYTARFAEGARHYRRALGFIESSVGLESDDGASLLHNLGGLEHARGRYRIGEPFARRGLEIRRRLHGADHPLVAEDEAALAAILDGLGRFDESEPLYQHALGVFRRIGARLDVALNENNLAAVRHERGDLVGAARLYRRVIRAREAMLGNAHPDVAVTLHNLSRVERDRGRRIEAERAAARALRIATRRLGTTHATTRTIREGHEQLRGERGQG